MAQSVRDVMTKDPVALPGDATIEQAAARMRDDGIGDVIVLDGDQIAGIVTDRDITVRAVADGRSPGEVRLSDVCSGELVTVSPDDSIDAAVKAMREADVRRIPVVEGGRAIGIVAIGDLAVERDPGSALGDISAADPNT